MMRTIVLLLLILGSASTTYAAKGDVVAHNVCGAVGNAIIKARKEPPHRTTFTHYAVVEDQSGISLRKGDIVFFKPENFESGVPLKITRIDGEFGYFQIVGPKDPHYVTNDIYDAIEKICDKQAP